MQMINVPNYVLWNDFIGTSISCSIDLFLCLVPVMIIQWYFNQAASQVL